jgi:hypothetical protein
MIKIIYLYRGCFKTLKDTDIEPAMKIKHHILMANLYYQNFGMDKAIYPANFINLYIYQPIIVDIYYSFF